MQPNLYLKPLAVALVLGITGSAQAAEPVSLGHVTFKDLQQSFQMQLPGSKLKQAAHQVDSLQFIQQHQDLNRITHVRMQQMYAGYPVFGGYAIVHSKQQANGLMAASANSTMNGMVYRGLAQELGQVPANFKANAAKALADFKAKQTGGELSEDTVQPMVYIDEANKAHWAYQVSVSVHYKDKIPARPTAIVDAQSFKPFVKWNDIKTVKSKVSGMGFGGNHKMGEFQYGKDLPLLELSRDGDSSLCYMETAAVKVVDMQHNYYSKNNPMQFECPASAIDAANVVWTGYKADGYDRENGAASPTNDALYAGYVIKHMYHDWYGVEALKTSAGTPMQLVMRVHYGTGYENAYWDGKQMTFGDGDTMMYPLVSLGVGAHEISHGFTEQHSGLMYFGQSGGMNESFSDMAAQAAEYYSTGLSSWMIGSEIMKEDSGWEALRYMDKPSRDGRSIDTADAYYGGLDVHYSSGVYNHLFYLMSTQPGWDARKAFDVMVKANMDYWTPYVKFDDGACGVLNAAADLNYSLVDVRKALDEVKIKHESCMLVIQD